VTASFSCSSSRARISLLSLSLSLSFVWLHLSIVCLAIGMASQVSFAVATADTRSFVLRNVLLPADAERVVVHATVVVENGIIADVARHPTEAPPPAGTCVCVGARIAQSCAAER